MNKKIKRQSVKKSKPKKISKKKVGKGFNNLENDYKELLQLKQQGVQLTTTVDFTFKDGRKVGRWIVNHKRQLNKEQLEALGLIEVQTKPIDNDYKELLQLKQQGVQLTTTVDFTFKDGRKVGRWIVNHKRQLNKEQLEALGLIEVQTKPIDKYMKLKEKYIKALSSATSSSEKALLMNNLKQVEKLIGRETRKKIKGTGKKKSIKRGSGNGEQTAWMINPLYKSVKQPRQYEEAYGTFEIGEIAPIISRRVVYKKGKTPQKAEKVELAKAMYTNPEVGERKVVKRKTFSKVY